MAVVADIDDLDLVVEPHEWTPEDQEAIRLAVVELRTRETDVRLVEHVRQWLAQRGKPAHQASRRPED